MFMNRFISFMTRHSLLFVTAVAIVVLTSGFVGVPFWDEDEPRFAAIAQTMVETGNWTVPLFNGELAVDKPVLMHWCMAACFSIFGMNEIAARLPAALAALLTSLALLRLGTRCFSVATGVVAALAYLGCLLVAIESHAATPDSILVALSTWATILLIEPFLLDRRQPTSNTRQPAQSRNDSFVSVWHAVLAGSLLGLGVLCKGPIGYVGPLVVVVGWVWLFQCLSGEKERPAGIRLREQVLSTLRHVLSSGIPSALHTIKHTRLLIVTIAAVFVAAPWYVSVGVQTDWEWTKGFFFVHNVGRFVAPMEKHSGGLLFHPLTMLVGFYPWSCFLPLAVFAATRQLWKTWRQGQRPRIEESHAPALSLLLFWMSVWIGGFSLAATKLPNYIMPAYPAAALLVSALAIEAVKRSAWLYPRWMGIGIGGIAFGGIATSVTILVGSFYGLNGSEPAALIGLIPLAGVFWLVWCSRQQPAYAVTTMVCLGLLYSSLAVGPTAAWISRANTLPALIREAHAHAGGHARIGAYSQITPNLVYYAHGIVKRWAPDSTRAQKASNFLATGPDAVLVIPENQFHELSSFLPETAGVVGRARPLFKTQDFLLVGNTKKAERTDLKRSALRRSMKK